MTLISTDADPVSGRERLLAGDAPAAVEILSRAAAASPADLDIRYWLASAKLAVGDPEAASAMEDARALHALIEARGLGADIARCGTDTAYAGEIATHLYSHGLAAMSGVVRGMALSSGAADVQSLLSYALALQHQGRIEEACAAFGAAISVNPSPAVRQFLIYPQLLCENGDARHFAAAREWLRLCAPARPAAPHPNPDRRGRKLRIGYVAPRFAGCQLQQFMAPLLDNHDPEAVSVILYPTQAETETGWPKGIEVHPLGRLDDAAAAALIRADGIDVLADCWGHTAGSRLPVFAHRPAPVQVAWINFIQSTGLDQMDYVLHADAEEPPPAEVFSERIWPIGPVFNAFRPAPGRLPPSPTPALSTGRITFGSFNHPAKLSDATLDAWAAILRGAPASRLLLKYSYFRDPVLQRVTQARFAARGVAPERLVFAAHSTGESYVEAFREVDLMLDAWPAPGSTTTLDALSNGVPVLVLAEPGSRLASRYARTILQASGLAELVAASPRDFAERAIALTADPGRLDALRARVRPGFDNGGCCDEAAFTRRVEAAFGEMFDVWRSRRSDRDVA